MWGWIAAAIVVVVVVVVAVVVYLLTREEESAPPGPSGGQGAGGAGNGGEKGPGCVKEPCVESTTGDLEVTVTDRATGNPIQGATVTITRGAPQTGTTDSDGKATFKGIELGSYKVEAAKTGYLDPATTANVVAQPTTSVGLQLIKDPQVTLERVRRGNPYVSKNASTTSGMPDSVPPSKTYEVEIKVTPSLDGSGHHIDLAVINTSVDNGTATVSPTRITKTTKVTVKGDVQTKPGHAGKLKIQAKLDGATVKAESAGFTVCAHPFNYRDPYHSDVNGASIGMRVSDDWDSDSGTFADLDETEISELVAEVRSDSPPFGPRGAGRAVNSGYLPGDQRTIDTHTIAPRPPAGPAGKRIFDQLCIFKCKRCGATDKVMPNSGFKITHEVFLDGAQWKHKTTKNGAAVTIGAHSTQAGGTNATSPDHNLP